jgi:hypothetical protein
VTTIALNYAISRSRHPFIEYASQAEELVLYTFIIGGFTDVSNINSAIHHSFVHVYFACCKRLERGCNIEGSVGRQ